MTLKASTATETATAHVLQLQDYTKEKECEDKDKKSKDNSNNTINNNKINVMPLTCKITRSNMSTCDTTSKGGRSKRDRIIVV